MLRSLWSCAWLGSRDTGPSRAILLCGPGRLLYSSTRQEMQCCMTQGFPKFWSKYYHLYPEMLLIRKVKLNEKRKEISWFEKTAAAFWSQFWLFSLGAPLTRAVKPLAWGDETAAIWFGFPFPESFSTIEVQEYLSDQRICEYRLNRSLKGMLW